MAAGSCSCWPGTTLDASLTNATWRPSALIETLGRTFSPEAPNWKSVRATKLTAPMTRS